MLLNLLFMLKKYSMLIWRVEESFSFLQSKYFSTHGTSDSFLSLFAGVCQREAVPLPVLCFEAKNYPNDPFVKMSHSFHILLTFLRFCTEVCTSSNFTSYYDIETFEVAFIFLCLPTTVDDILKPFLGIPDLQRKS